MIAQTRNHIHTYAHSHVDFVTDGCWVSSYLPVGFASVRLHLFIAVVISVVAVVIVIISIDARWRCIRRCCRRSGAAICYCCWHRTGSTLVSIARYFQLQKKKLERTCKIKSNKVKLIFYRNGNGDSTASPGQLLIVTVGWGGTWLKAQPALFQLSFSLEFLYLHGIIFVVHRRTTTTTTTTMATIMSRARGP